MTRRFLHDGWAANTTAGSQAAYKFAVYGLHSDEASAKRAVAERFRIAPWLAGSSEVFAAVLTPFRHFGEANFLGEPGPCFDVTASPPSPDTPIVIVTSVGWRTFDDESMTRIKRFSEGVSAVRIGMTGMPGLQSQQSFSFPGGLVHDGVTVTLWHNVASAMAFAYGPGFHRSQVKEQREVPYGDRTSFTRFAVVSSEGTWHGTNLFEPSATHS